MSLRSLPRQLAVDMAVAFQFLTRLPVPQVEFAPDGLARAVKFFPVVGLVVGAGGALLQRVLAPHLGRPASGLAVLLYLVLITGCLHEDGLADVADSLGGWNPEQRLAILHDSRIGSYGAAALVLSLLGRAVLLAELPLEHFAAYLITAHVLCRWSTLPLSYYLPPARESEGQGARVAQLTSASSLIGGVSLHFGYRRCGFAQGRDCSGSVGNPCFSAQRLLLHAKARRRDRRLLWRNQSAYGDCRLPLRSVAAMSRVLFIRHAETDMAGRFCGHSDPDVNAKGRAQLTELAHLLSAEAIDAVYSSDLRRARSTAQAIAAARNIPLSLRPALREIDFGQWEGLSWEQIEQLRFRLCPQVDGRLSPPSRALGRELPGL
jgi:adenosylcobinamide-GDP ribazoletransferase